MSQSPEITTSGTPASIVPGATAPQSAGMRDIIALSSSITSIEDGVLSYRGVTIDELAEHASFEEVKHLLWYGRFPNRAELERLRKQIAEQAVLPAGLIEVMKSFPRRTTPMEALRTAVSALATFDAESEDMTDEANQRKAIRIQGQIASIVAAFDRLRNDRQPIGPRPELSLAANFLFMLRGTTPDPLSVRAARQGVHSPCGSRNKRLHLCRTGGGGDGDGHALSHRGGDLCAQGTVARRSQRAGHENAQRNRSSRPCRLLHPKQAAAQGKDHGLRPRRL